MIQEAAWAQRLFQTVHGDIGSHRSWHEALLPPVAHDNTTSSAMKIASVLNGGKKSSPGASGKPVPRSMPLGALPMEVQPTLRVSLTGSKEPLPLLHDDILDVEFQPLPIDFTLARTSLELGEVPHDLLLQRLSTFLRCHSVDYRIQNERMDCLTPDLLHFAIYLYETQNGVVVHAERRKGCSVGMHRLRTSLYAALQTDGNQQQSGVSLSNCLPKRKQEICSKVKEAFLQTLREKGIEPEAHQEQCWVQALRGSEALLESTLPDQTRLGLEALLYLLHSAHGPDVVRSAFAQDTIVRRQVLTFLTHTSSRDFVDSLEYDPDYHAWVLHHLSLKVLSQALQVAYEQSMDLQLGSRYWRTLSQYLRRDTRQARSRPHDGALALLCLRRMGRGHARGLGEAVLDAEVFGRSKHRQLEEAACELLLDEDVDLR